MAEHVLVTGGAGFIGSHLADALLAAGHRVRVLDALEPQVHGTAAVPAWLDGGAEFVRGSVRDADVVRRVLQDVDVVFHEAAQVGVAQSMYAIARYVADNVAGTAVLLEEIVRRRDRVRKLVVASSMSIYGEGAYRDRAGTVRRVGLRTAGTLAAGEWEIRDPVSGETLEPIPTPESQPAHPTSVYAITKRDQEELCLAVGRAYGIPTVALRYFNVYGARQALSNPYTGVAAIFASRLLNGRGPVIFEDGLQSRDFVHVSDVVRANLLAVECDAADYEAVNVGTGQATTLLQVAAALARPLGCAAGPEITGGFRTGDIRHCVADISRARALLGYAPQVDVAEGMAAYGEWVRGQLAEDRFEQARWELTERGLA